MKKLFFLFTCCLLMMGAFAQTFKIAYDEVLQSLEIVRPDNSIIPLRATPIKSYYLSQAIPDSIKCPVKGDWKIRVIISAPLINIKNITCKVVYESLTL